MVKKIYIQPKSLMIEIESERYFLNGSMKGSIDEEPGIEWGGTDTDGTIEPQSQKLKRDFWGNENYWE